MYSEKKFSDHRYVVAMPTKVNFHLRLYSRSIVSSCSFILLDIELAEVEIQPGTGLC